METETARFTVERQEAIEGEWSRVMACNSIDYARLVASTGFRRHLGFAYRVVHQRTGKAFVLCSPTGPRVERDIPLARMA